jgi:poly(3-hydroxybutyrate) depolymerase
MISPRTRLSLCHAVALLIALPPALSTVALGQGPPYDVFPPAQPPYYRVRFEAATREDNTTRADNTTQANNATQPNKKTQPNNKTPDNKTADKKTQPGGLIFPVNYTIWIPENVKRLRGVIVHQHGCGEGSCKSGLTGAYDLHWQALAKKHDCALLAPSYEQPEKADCQMWCDPRNGSAAAFQRGLVELGKMSGHPELAEVPWALWGHSGGGHWAGGMVLLYPERVAAAWLRSGVPLLEPNPVEPSPGRPPIKAHAIKAHTLPAAALQVPVMCNLGTKEGVTTKGGPFANVWTANEAFFKAVRKRGGLVGVAVDPLTAHECGNQRYLAIPWLDACLSVRLPKASGQPLQPMPADAAWLAEPTGTRAESAAKFAGDPLQAAWLPNAAIARAWMQYVKDTAVPDTTPPPAPTSVRVTGNVLSWQAEADLESGLARFVIERDGEFLANVPQRSKNPFGRLLFQNLQYSDTPTQPLVPMQFTDTKSVPGRAHIYRVTAVNTVGLQSKPSADPVAADGLH